MLSLFSFWEAGKEFMSCHQTQFLQKRAPKTNFTIHNVKKDTSYRNIKKDNYPGSCELVIGVRYVPVSFQDLFIRNHIVFNLIRTKIEIEYQILERNRK